MKGIVLAGGYGTRLYPMTRALSKQLLPVYDKPMIYYPITALMELGIREILLLTHPSELSGYQQLLKDGSQWGITISYKTQPRPMGIADHLRLASDFIQNAPIALILGDNIFYGHHWVRLRNQVQNALPKATVVTYFVENPKSYGVIEFKEGTPVRLIEKSKHLISRQAITGLYFYDASVVDQVNALSNAERSALTLTLLNNIYLEQQRLHIFYWPVEAVWFDAGTPETLLAAANCIQALQAQQNILVGSPEAIAWRLGYIDAPQVEQLIQNPPCTEYDSFLLKMLSESLVF